MVLANISFDEPRHAISLHQETFVHATAERLWSRIYRECCIITSLFFTTIGIFLEAIRIREMGENPYMPKIVPITSDKLPGGIASGGNTCYIAVVLQLLASLSDFDMPLQQELLERPGENLGSLCHRKELQAALIFLINKIRSCKLVSANEVNNLRFALRKCNWEETSLPWFYKIFGIYLPSFLAPTGDVGKLFGNICSILDIKTPESIRCIRIIRSDDNGAQKSNHEVAIAPRMAVGREGMTSCDPLDLTHIICHVGSTVDGHSYLYHKLSPHRWCKCDNSAVHSVDFSNIQREESRNCLKLIGTAAV